MKFITLLITLIFSLIVLCEHVNAQCPHEVEEVYEDLLTFLNDNRFQQDRVNIGLANISESEITILNDNQHLQECTNLSQEHPFDQSRSTDVYPGPDRITYYKIRDLYVIVKVNRRFFEVDEDEIWVDLVPTYVIVYNSEFERMHQFFFK